jgi:DNA-binding LytR/AlgR family response regulator
VTDTAICPPDPRAGVRASAPRVYLIAGAVALVVAVSGLAHDLERAAEFAVYSLIGATAGLATARWLAPRAWYQDRLWAIAILIAAVVTVPITMAIIACAMLIHHEAVTPAFAAGVLPQVFVSSLVMTGLALFLRVRSTQTHAAPVGAPPAKFLARLPAKLAGAELFAVEAEDHYLRLHTSRGQDLILMRLSDAIAELEGLEGAQTHRSWWVAKSAVADVTKLDGRAVLTLKDGAEVPVSRGFAKDLRSAGWL